MYANNEVGVVQPIEEIGELLKNHPAYFHTDAVQAYGSLSINVQKAHIDLLSVSSHKINGPKGIGFLYQEKLFLLNRFFTVDSKSEKNEQVRKMYRLLLHLQRQSN